VEDLTAQRVGAYLLELEEKRGCSVATRNQRLAALHALAHFIALHSPEHVAWCGTVRAIAFKKAPQPLVSYLEKKEMDALLAAADVSRELGQRDHALLLFLYNSGARANEAAQVAISDLQLGLNPESDSSAVLIRGKGNKWRRCPLWARTINELRPLVSGRAPPERVFLNRRGQPMTRFGIHALVERYAAQAAVALPAMAGKRVSPHVIRHTTATQLLRAGVDINTIRAWLGHVSLATTNVYAGVDLEMKARALAQCEVEEEERKTPWREEEGLMEFLRNL